MAEELYYTSANRGLRPGSRGFCTVAYTRGMSPFTIRLLESLSGYRGAYAVHDPRAAVNPVAYSHYRTTLAGKNLSILSRVGDSGADHTNRTNKIAHHVVLSTRERVPGGPAWMAMQDGFLNDVWEGEPEEIGHPKAVPDGDSGGTFAAHWEELTGDAGWAGMLAYAFQARAAVPAYIVFEPGMQVLPLIAESLALLDVKQRWLVTFNTYFTTLPAGITCHWRCCVPDAACLREARRNPRATILDLTNMAGAPRDHRLVALARGQDAPEDPSPSTATSNFVILANRRQQAIRMKPEPRIPNGGQNDS